MSNRTPFDIYLAGTLDDAIEAHHNRTLENLCHEVHLMNLRVCLLHLLQHGDTCDVVDLRALSLKLYGFDITLLDGR